MAKILNMDNIDAEMSSTEDRTFHSDERMDVRMNDRQLACIEYPGIVQNTDKAIQSLGGIQAVNKSIKDDSKRLEVRFRPDDLYCKPACGTLHKVTGLVLRVRRRKVAATGEGVPETGASSSVCGDAGDHQGDGYEYKVDMLGTVLSVIKFQGMCDFQYLPVERKTDGSYENVLDKLVMRTFTSADDYMARKAPLFLSPIVFSRFDTPQDYGFLLKRRKTEGVSIQPVETLSTERKARQKFTTVISFADPTPQQATDECLAHVEKFKDTELLDTLKELFEERPVWSRSAILYRLRNKPSIVRNLKDVLPAFAYFFLTGPWRTFWVKMGYDPRQDPSAKKFQGIDFRRQRGPGESLTEPVWAKKRDYQRKKEVASEINLNFLREGDIPEKEDSTEPKLRDFEFHADILPPYRQIVYMVCDIFDAEVQALLSKNDGKETKCDERNGWCVANFADRCRGIMNQHVDKLCPYQLPVNKKYLRKKKQKQKALQLSDSEDTTIYMDTSSFDDSTLR